MLGIAVILVSGTFNIDKFLVDKFVWFHYDESIPLLHLAFTRLATFALAAILCASPLLKSKQSRAQDTSYSLCDQIAITMWTFFASSWILCSPEKRFVVDAIGGLASIMLCEGVVRRQKNRAKAAKEQDLDLNLNLKNGEENIENIKNINKFKEPKEAKEVKEAKEPKGV
jgi:hypothetical protein